MAAVAEAFDRDLEADFATIEKVIATARADGVQLLALPEACLGGYLAHLNGGADEPPPLHVDGPEIARLADLAGDMVVCAGYCEADGDKRFNSVVCVYDGRVLGNHRKVHQPLRENASYDSGDSFAAFDTPVGRIGLLICFPGFAMVTAGELAGAEAGPAITADCGELVAGQGVRLRWPDGELTGAIDAGVTGLGTAA